VGRYSFTILSRPRDITLDPAYPGIASVAVHEIGHYIDRALLGRPRVFASDGSPLLLQWARAIANSDSWQTIRSARNNPSTQLLLLPSGLSLLRQANYLLLAQELFARSYSQYIAVRSGDTRLLDELRHDQTSFHFPEQWPDADFAEIEKAFDVLLHDLQWET
jgi:hypothetical protein